MFIHDIFGQESNSAVMTNSQDMLYTSYAITRATIRSYVAAEPPLTAVDT
jgi:hypothetical protein